MAPAENVESSRETHLGEQVAEAFVITRTFHAPRELVFRACPPERLVFVSSFSDEEGGVTRAPFFDGGWPLETLSTLTFTERDGRTTVTLVAVPIHATDAERATFRSAHASMHGGWGGTFDQLAAYLEARS